MYLDSVISDDEIIQSSDLPTWKLLLAKILLSEVGRQGFKKAIWLTKSSARKIQGALGWKHVWVQGTLRQSHIVFGEPDQSFWWKTALQHCTDVLRCTKHWREKTPISKSRRKRELFVIVTIGLQIKPLWAKALSPPLFLVATTSFEGLSFLVLCLFLMKHEHGQRPIWTFSITLLVQKTRFTTATPPVGFSGTTVKVLGEAPLVG